MDEALVIQNYQTWPDIVITITRWDIQQCSYRFTWHRHTLIPNTIAMVTPKVMKMDRST